MPMLALPLTPCIHTVGPPLAPYLPRHRRRVTVLDLLECLYTYVQDEVACLGWFHPECYGMTADEVRILGMVLVVYLYTV